MRAQPKRWPEGYFDEEPMVHHFPNGDVLIECSIVAPASSEGRNIDLHITVDMVPQLLKALRTAAIAVRNKPMSTDPAARSEGS